MSGIRSLLSRAIGALGGPQAATMVLVAGILVGGMGGVLIAGSHPGSSPSTNTVAIYPCPNQGPALLTVAAGQQLLVTGRLADNSWVRIHLPTPGRTEGWVEAGPLTVNGSLDTLPVATCSAEAAAPSPAIVPVESLTAIINASPSPAPTPTPSPSPSPTPTPSPTPNLAPTLAQLQVSTRSISYDQGSYCPTAIKRVTISVKASDTTGIAGVTLFWREPGASSFAQVAMNESSGDPTNGTWQATLDTAANGITQAGTLAYYVVATDAAGATSRAPSKGSGAITVAVCANKGPTITGASSSSGSTLYSDPAGHGGCQTATDITAAVADVDGVKSVTLFYRKPGGSTYAFKPMNNTTLPGKWYANLDTLGDQLAPPNGTLSWYIRAVDTKNVASETKAASITVLPCGIVITGFSANPVNVGFAAVGGPVCSNNTTVVTLTATDAGSTLASFATLHLVSPQGTQVLATAKGSGVYQFTVSFGSTSRENVPGTWTLWAVIGDAAGTTATSAQITINASALYCKP